ncbi:MULTISPECIES: ectoine/hydroxyectoine ABC transporter permease subunit EhuD [Nocardiopsis]|uniref:Ectoine/hydroxyectoine ABC transporter permease subunit EhuD n=1 Tax=Nocardiopsis lambiniae TaxID=3075539 RepID=A0ABU2MDN7_9ACTN|nr:MULTISPECIES: ectoine/hydroxyectoine ABC transporter permease subunit EhuD [unclassified Nocardiopsis]MDE3724421.1 ectoine/hydroxyectoine ABC transporter permease subunit EhuD [Nocardiopsis sp. N85]MDT0330727.1 ectoine/hydroxyectoine ABC transporter permease subunit EhuD [Nocardiopsis sp. DSM 44743]
MIWDFEWTWQVMPDLMQGLAVTVQATVFGYLIALVLGLAIAMVRRVPVIGTIVHAVMEFIRTTPLLVQLVFVFALAPSTVSALTVGIVVLGVHYSAYTAEVYRSGIEGVPKGQWEAARALSLPAGRTWGAVVLPQAIRKVIPALGNYLIAMFKDTPLLLAITVTELLATARQVGSAGFRIVEAYTVVGFLFLLVSIPSAILIRRLERRYAAV